MVQPSAHDGRDRRWSRLLIAILMAALAPSVLQAWQLAEADGNASEAVAAMARHVSLNDQQRSRRAALADVCRQAGIGLSLDTEALAAV